MLHEIDAKFFLFCILGQAESPFFFCTLSCCCYFCCRFFCRFRSSKAKENEKKIIWLEFMLSNCCNQKKCKESGFGMHGT